MNGYFKKNHMFLVNGDFFFLFFFVFFSDSIKNSHSTVDNPKLGGFFLEAHRIRADPLKRKWRAHQWIHPKSKPLKGLSIFDIQKGLLSGCLFTRPLPFASKWTDRYTIVKNYCRFFNSLKKYASWKKSSYSLTTTEPILYSHIFDVSM